MKPTSRARKKDDAGSAQGDNAGSVGEDRGFEPCAAVGRSYDCGRSGNRGGGHFQKKEQ